MGGRGKDFIGVFLFFFLSQQRVESWGRIICTFRAVCVRPKTATKKKKKKKIREKNIHIEQESFDLDYRIINM